MIAATPVLPTTAAIAPNAPIGATHMIIARMRNTSAWICRIAPRIGVPFAPIFCSAKPTSRATNSTCRMLPSTSDDSSEVGMMPRMNSLVVFASVVPAS